MSTIVVGVDGSSSAEGGARWAAEEAAIRGEVVRLVHAAAVPLHGYPDFVATYPQLRDGMRQQGEQWLDAARQVVERTAPRVTVETELADGEAAEVLLGESAKARLVVLGSRGLGGFTGMLMGSVAAALAAHAHSPVVVVRCRGEDTVDEVPPEEGPVVVGVDGSEPSTAALRFAFDTAATRRQPLVVVRAWSAAGLDEGLSRHSLKVDPEEIEAAERSALAEQVKPLWDAHPDVAVDTVVARGRAARTLLDYAAGARLLVVGSRGRTGFRGILLGSTSRALVTHAPCPVAVLRRGESTGD